MLAPVGSGGIELYINEGLFKFGTVFGALDRNFFMSAQLIMMKR